jgi:hypothetical protein
MVHGPAEDTELNMFERGSNSGVPKSIIGKRMNVGLFSLDISFETWKGHARVISSQDPRHDS